MKATLTATLIAQRLTIETRPVYGPKGDLRFEPTTDRTPFLVFDSHRDAPTGFGVKISATKKTFIVQRRVGAKVIKAKVGDVSDFPSVDAARDAARALLGKMKETGANPNVAEREREARGDVVAADMTVADAFGLYRKYLTGRAKPAKDSSLRNLDLALRRLERPGIDLAMRGLGSLRDDDVVKAFDALAASPRPPHPLAKKKTKAKPGPGIRTATEQTFRWATTATAYVLEKEQRRASQERRAPTLTTNPFHALRSEDRFRTREQLEQDYAKSRARNPLSIADGSLPAFLRAVWNRRCDTPNNRTAADYLLLTVLWGTRRGEAAPLRWRSLLTPAEAAITPFVDLDARKVYFPDTKNGTEHTLPLADAALELLQRRWEDRPKRNVAWVFPARSSRAKQGHYLDSKAILAGIRKTAGLDVLRTHDLRRTFGAMAEEMASYKVAKALLNHRSLSDPTDRYTTAVWTRIREAMQRVETAMLSSAPDVRRAILGHQLPHPEAEPEAA